MGQDKETYVKSTLATEYASSPLPGKGQLYNPIKLEGDLLSSSGETTVSTTSCTSSSSSITTQSEVASMPSSPRSLSSSQSLTRQGSTSKILLFHPSIISPSKARKLEGVKYVTVLYNPKSGNKRGEKVMRQVVAKFQRNGLQVTTVQLEHKNHATEFCKNKVDFTDMEVLCVIGGDGTFHEVVNGLMQHPLSRIAPHCLPILSVVPAGTGNSMVRELQGIASVRVSTDEVLFGTSVAMDILKVTILSVKKEHPVNEVPQPPKREGETCDEAFKNEEEYIERIVGGKKYVQKEVIYAFNSIHWGLASRVLEKAEKLRWMGHGIRYTVASVMEMVQGSSTRARIVLEDAHGAVTEYENDTFCLVIANNIGTAGKGMTMAPKAKINDGLVDILLIRSHKPWHLMKLFEKLYNGTHVDLPYVEYKQVRKFSIFPYKKTGEVGVQGELEFAEEVVDVDGELKGFTPFECEVLPLALELII